MGCWEHPDFIADLVGVQCQGMGKGHGAVASMECQEHPDSMGRLNWLECSAQVGGGGVARPHMLADAFAWRAVFRGGRNRGVLQVWDARSIQAPYAG